METCQRCQKIQPIPSIIARKLGLIRIWIRVREKIKKEEKPNSLLKVAEDQDKVILGHENICCSSGYVRL